MSYYTTIPVGLCKYALVNRKINQLKLYLYLKLNSSGYIKYQDNINEHITDWSNELKIDRKTVSSSFKWLINNKWITINGVSKAIHIKGYIPLAIKLGIEIKTSVVYEPNNFKDLKAICCAAVIIYFRNKLRYINRQRKSEANMKLSNKNFRLLKKGFYCISLEYIAKCLEVSKSTANNYKKLASQFGYIDSRRNIYLITNVHGEPISKNVAYLMPKELINRGRIRRGEKYLKAVGTDIIGSNITLKKFRF